jgi:hypothetical protein
MTDRPTDQSEPRLTVAAGETALDPVSEQGIPNPTRAGRGDRDHEAIERGLERLDQATLGH